MATCFDRWEKDPFFPAAEEVQESADRMQSAYRRWIHERKAASNPTGDAKDISGELGRELHTALGTAKWQLEELERAVVSNDNACSAGEDTRARHSQFVEAIGIQISEVEDSLKESSLEKGEAKLSWVRLDEGERDELALFLSAPPPQLEKVPVIRSVGELEVPKYPPKGNGPNGGEGGVHFKNSSCSTGVAEKKKERLPGHRRTASASADFGALKILVSNEAELPNLPPPKTPSFSCLARALESTSKMKWSNNGFRKWKGGDQHQEEETIPLRNNKISMGLNSCYERTKSCLDSCSNGSYDKQLYGWVGVLHRQLQRSQYQIQYGRPIQMVLWAIVVVVLIALLALRAI